MLPYVQTIYKCQHSSPFIAVITKCVPLLLSRFRQNISLNTLNRKSTLRWRHNDHAGVSNHQPHGCLLNRLFRRKSRKTSKLRVTGLCAGNSPGTGEFPAQMASYAENVSIWWRHHVLQDISQALIHINMLSYCHIYLPITYFVMLGTYIYEHKTTE